MCKPEKKNIDKLDYIKIKVSQRVKIQNTNWEEIFIIFTTPTTHKNIAFQNIKEALTNQKKNQLNQFFLKGKEFNNPFTKSQRSKLGQAETGIRQGGLEAEVVVKGPMP